MTESIHFTEILPSAVSQLVKVKMPKSFYSSLLCVILYLPSQFSGALGGAGLTAGLNDFKGLFQPK